MSAKFKRFFSFVLCMAMLCSSTVPTTAAEAPSSRPALESSVSAAESGDKVSNKYGIIDYSTAEDGYIKVKYSAQTDKLVRALIYRDGNSRYYSNTPLTPGADWTVLWLPDAKLSYSIRLQEQDRDNLYFRRLEANLDASAASTKQITRNEYACIDYSTAEYGYVKVKYTAHTDRQVGVKVERNNDRICSIYLTPGADWVKIPLSAGDGSYCIKVLEHTGNGSTWTRRLTLDFDVSMSDPFAPFLLSYPMINYADAPNAVALANSLTANCATDKEKADAICNFVAGHISYDFKNMYSYAADYIPDLDGILSGKSGICIDYSALMCGMLRSLNIPAKMVYGYVSNGDYHAWVSVYTPDSGWTRYDPTLLSNASNKARAYDRMAIDSNYVPTEFF